jgi:transposase
VAAVRELNRLEILGETLHHALKMLAQIAPAWLQDQVSVEWFLRYGQRFSDDRLPKEPNDRHTLAVTIGCDGYH